MEFEWDKKKAASNEIKHGVSFQEAGTIFGDPLALTYNDPDHSINENRYITFGISRLGKNLVVSHTERGDKTRIISARQMTKNERTIYEEG
ncbi:MAG: BrnT family toxin [Candidatus Scalindua sp.]|nr:BrnT family toxin [Candidatus Scalindua sp.]